MFLLHPPYWLMARDQARQYFALQTLQKTVFKLPSLKSLAVFGSCPWDNSIIVEPRKKKTLRVSVSTHIGMSCAD